MTPLKIGFVGAGNRMRNYYHPVIDQLEKEGLVDVIGFFTRTQTTADEYHTKISTTRHKALRCYKSISDLSHDVDALIICVPATALSAVTLECIRTSNVHLFVETPLTDEFVARQLHTLDNQDRKITIAENWPYRPAEILKQQVINSGLLGEVNAVVNDFRGYEYHGVAMLRALVGGNPITNIMANIFSTGPVTFVNSEGDVKTLHEHWWVGQMNFKNGPRGIYNFNSAHSRTHARGERSIRALCKNGAIASDDEKNFHAYYSDEAGPHRADATVTYSGNQVRAIKITVKDNIFEWHAPPGREHFDQQQHSTATLLNKFVEYINGKITNPYAPIKARQDYIACIAMQESSNRGGQWLKI